MSIEIKVQNKIRPQQITEGMSFNFLLLNLFGLRLILIIITNQKICSEIIFILKFRCQVPLNFKINFDFEYV